VKHDAPPGVADEEENWVRIDQFLRHVVPVATSAKVRLAFHPHDTYTPPRYKGVRRVLRTLKGLKRLVSMHESPCHRLNFCQVRVLAGRAGRPPA
jgi:mannonate dehydratase